MMRAGRISSPTVREGVNRTLTADARATDTQLITTLVF